jgi:DNA-binding beta-propeller fold protein YncE
MKSWLTNTCLVSALALLASAGPALPQQAATAQNVPELAYKAVPNFFKIPPGRHPGETQGVATNSKGDVFIFFRGNPTELWQFDKNGNFIREIGHNYFGFLFAHAVRVDSQDNIWAVDEGTNVITKFSPDGSKILMVIGHRPDPAEGLVAAGRGPNPPDEKYTLCRPSDLGWDQQGNIFVADGYCNNRVVKYDKNGRYIAQFGGNLAGSDNAHLSLPHGIQVDHQGNVYVADRSNARYVVLDNDLHYKTAYTNVGTAWGDCISQGAHQYLFASNSNPNDNPPGSWAITGQIYKMELDGTVLGKFGHAGKLAPGFQVVHATDCRDPNTLYVGEIESWRVQKFVLSPSK